MKHPEKYFPMVAEINDNLDVDDFKNMTPSEVVKKDYELCKERGDLAYFWQFAFAVQQELPFLIAENAEVFFRSITDEQFNAADAVVFAGDFDCRAIEPKS